jgi:hypothetical protein
MAEKRPFWLKMGAGWIVTFTAKKYLMRLLALTCLLICAVFSCKTDQRKLEKSEQLSNEAPSAEVSFRCETVMDENEVPASQVFLVINEQATKVADIQACDTIGKEDYQRYKMPNNALAACGGWFAGAGDYVYAVQLKDQIVVFQGYQDEMQTEDSFHYKEVAKVPLPK